MGSIGHLLTSIIKSAIRISACIISIEEKSIIPLSVGFIIAEIFGIVEEMVDQR